MDSIESGSAYVGRALVEAGVTVIFGVMGESNVDMLSCMVQRLGARYCAARHEQGAISMADGFARATGKVGVATVTYGPGAGNTITALTSVARHGNGILLVGGHRVSQGAAPQHHDPDDMYKSTGAIVVRVDDPSAVPGSVARAIALVAKTRTPVVLSFADTILEAPFRAGDAAAGKASEPLQVNAEASSRPSPHPSASLFAERLLGAKRPVIVAGRGALASGASPILAEIADQTGAALLTSLLGNGQFGSHPSALGICGGLATPLATHVMHEADVVLMIGTAFNGWTSDAGRAFASAEILHVDADPSAFDRAFRKTQHRIVGDAADVAADMLEAIRQGERPRQGNVRWWDGATVAVEPDRAYETGKGLDPVAVARAVGAVLPAQRTLVLDGGHFFESVCRSITVPDEKAFIWTLGYGSIGLGLGSAIGAAVGRPDRLTVLGVGDGGLLMSLPDLETVARYDLPLVILVMNDAAYGAEVKFLEERGWDGSIARFAATDFAAVAKALGLDAVTLHKSEDVEALLPRLAGLRSPLLIDAKVDQSETAEFMHLLNDLKAAAE